MFWKVFSIPQILSHIFRQIKNKNRTMEIPVETPSRHLVKRKTLNQSSGKKEMKIDREGESTCSIEYWILEEINNARMYPAHHRSVYKYHRITESVGIDLAITGLAWCIVGAKVAALDSLGSMCCRRAEIEPALAQKYTHKVAGRPVPSLLLCRTSHSCRRPTDDHRMITSCEILTFANLYIVHSFYIAPQFICIVFCSSLK